MAKFSIYLKNHPHGSLVTIGDILQPLAAGLAEAGCRVLLVDADSQGNVGVSLGLKPQHTLFHVLADEVGVDDAVVPIGRSFDEIGRAHV